MHARRILLPSTLAATLAASSGWAGNVYVQRQCGFPPEIDETPHSVTLEGRFGADASSSRWLVALAGHVDTLRVDGATLTVGSGEIEDGFLETAELGRIFLTVFDEKPGYRAVMMDSQIEGLGPGTR